MPRSQEATPENWDGQRVVGLMDGSRVLARSWPTLFPAVFHCGVNSRTCVV